MILEIEINLFKESSETAYLRVLWEATDEELNGLYDMMSNAVYRHTCPILKASAERDLKLVLAECEKRGI